jgi:hypothetical protein
MVKHVDKVSLATLHSKRREGSRCCFLGENKNGRRVVMGASIRLPWESGCIGLTYMADQWAWSHR